MVEAVANIWPQMPPDLFPAISSSSPIEAAPVRSNVHSNSPPPPPALLMDWNKDRKKAFRQALQEVYQTYSNLKVFVAGELGESLPNIVGDQTMMVACFELVEWGCAKG